jgi:hypothetical protein
MSSIVPKAGIADRLEKKAAAIIAAAASDKWG